jgi:thioredoxin reductase (NADPH)
MSEIRKTVIIGSGPAGLTAAIYAGRANLKPLLLAGETPGGQLTKTSEVENFPGFRKGIVGGLLMEEMIEQSKHCGAEIVYESAEKIDTSKKPFTITYGGGKVVQTHTLIFATGAAPRWLGVPGEEQYKFGGVTACAVCDGGFYRKQPVAVVGGGDSAMEEATYLSKLCSEVTIIHRREEFRASKVMVDRARNTPNIKWELNYAVDEIVGDPKKKTVTGVKIKSTKDGSIKQLNVNALFVAIGHIPTTKVLEGVVKLDQDGYIVCNDAQETSQEAVYAAGDCHDRRYRQAITAAGMGCKAALEVERYLTHHGL